MSKTLVEQRMAWRNAHAKQPVSVDLIDEMRKDANEQIDCSNARKKLAPEPLYCTPRRSEKRVTFRRRFSARTGIGAPIEQRH
jgi:hypothetical protein